MKKNENVKKNENENPRESDRTERMRSKENENGIVLDAVFATKNGAKTFHGVAKSELLKNIADPAIRYMAGKNIEEGAVGLKQDVLPANYPEELGKLFPEQFKNGKEFVYKGLRFRFLRPEYADNWDYSDDEDYVKNQLLLEKKESEVKALRQVINGIRAADRVNGKGRMKRPFSELKVILACHGVTDAVEYEINEDYEE